MPVLFLHGAGSNAATWWQQLPAFMARHVCLTLDLRCFGRSAAPMAEFRHEHFVADVLAVLDHFEVPRAVVVGQSLGGMVGLRLALQHPARVAAFVACDSPLGVDQPAILDALERRARTGGIADARTACARRVVPATLARARRALRADQRLQPGHTQHAARRMARRDGPPDGPGAAAADGRAARHHLPDPVAGRPGRPARAGVGNAGSRLARPRQRAGGGRPLRPLDLLRAARGVQPPRAGLHCAAGGGLINERRRPGRRSTARSRSRCASGWRGPGSPSSRLWPTSESRRCSR
ncbi:MAG: alpha/beta fold hydrolase [Betaproteobacteria bacterium]|nr:alpha/beta fold hydrolase [Betaproteobacteria bacterium]